MIKKESKEINLAKNTENQVVHDENYVNRDLGKSFEQLILENVNFAYSVVHKEFSKYPQYLKEDLLSAAKEGLVKAASMYDNTQNNNNFISYAVNWIRYYVQEEIRKSSPIKLNQNFITKRNKVTSYIASYKKQNNGELPTNKDISEHTGLSEKVVKNILHVNNGDNFNFISFNAIMTPSGKNEDDGTQLENKLTNEYIEEAGIDQGMLNLELQDLLSVLKKKVSLQDYNIFIDKYLNNLSTTDIAKKYHLNFPATAAYKIKCVEKVCKELVS